MDNTVTTVVEQQCQNLGWLIKQKLQATKIQKNTIAKHCGISVNTLNNAIKGHNINIGTLLSILEALGMNFIDAANSLQVSHDSGTISFPQASNILTSTEPEVDIKSVVTSVKETSVNQTALRMGETTENIAQLSQGI